ncbi:MAG: hypothetical protein M1837_007474 [Sclerophora amabilis]|nr:MAG: hypothetical protein M1837_007474 [Sclerophora amabilis]
MALGRQWQRRVIRVVVGRLISRKEQPASWRKFTEHRDFRFGARKQKDVRFSLARKFWRARLRKSHGPRDRQTAKRAEKGTALEHRTKTTGVPARGNLKWLGNRTRQIYIRASDTETEASSVATAFASRSSHGFGRTVHGRFLREGFRSDGGGGG